MVNKIIHTSYLIHSKMELSKGAFKSVARVVNLIWKFQNKCTA
jgi:hypothetical protein